MPAVRYTLDAPTSKLTIRTGTVGMFSPLAHDLELAAGALRGELELDGDAYSVRVQVHVAQLRVAGVVKRGKLDADALSARDRAEIERRIREDVFRTAGDVLIEARGTGRTAAVDVRVGAGVARVSVGLSKLTRDALEARADGECELSIKALGLTEVRGPLNAFRVADTLHVRFDVTFRAPAAT